MVNYETLEKVISPLGNTFQTSLTAISIEREGGTARLEEAVAAYRAALEERTRERVPLDWAGTQTNLGNALRRLGEREGGTARLREAITAYDAALEGFDALGAQSAIDKCRAERDKAQTLLAQRQS